MHLRQQVAQGIDRVVRLLAPCWLLLDAGPTTRGRGQVETESDDMLHCAEYSYRSVVTFGFDLTPSLPFSGSSDRRDARGRRSASTRSVRPDAEDDGEAGVVSARPTQAASPLQSPRAFTVKSPRAPY